MRRPLKFAALVAAAFAFTACADSARNPITEPNGLSLAKGTEMPLSAGLQALYDESLTQMQALHCTSARASVNALKDMEKLLTYAKFGWWTETDGAADGAASHENVAYIVEKIIANNESLLAAGKLTCVSDAAALVAEIEVLLRAFAAQGEYVDPDGQTAVFSCPAGEPCDEQTTGPNGFGVTAPPGTFGNNDVFIVVRPYTPSAEKNAVGNAWRFDVLGFEGEEAGPWTRWICWDGSVGGEVVDPNPDYVVMVRDPENGDPFEFLSTESNDTRCVEQVSSMNPVLRGAYKLFAGLPFLPSLADAYSPPRTFGGTSTAASPHWLTVVPPPPPTGVEDLDALCAKTYEYSPSTANAACTHLDGAAECAEGDNICWNGKLDSFINVIEAQSGKNDLTTEEADELIDDAEALKRPVIN